MPSPESSRRNLQRARDMGRVCFWRGRDETRLIKLAIYQSAFDPSPHKTQRALARELHVSQQYVCKVLRGATGKLDQLAGYQVEHGPVTPAALEAARQVSERMGFAPAPQSSVPEKPRMTEDEAIAERWRQVREWKRKGLNSGGGRRVLFSVPVR